MSKELAVINNDQKNAVSTYTGKLFSDIDFEGLNAIINRIAENKEELTDGMRAAATEYAKKWDDIVVERLQDKQIKLSSMVEWFETCNTSFYGLMNLIEGTHSWESGHSVRCNDLYYALISLFDSKEEWKEYSVALQDLNNKYHDYKEGEEDAPVIEDFVENPDDMSYNERLVKQKEFEIELAKYTVARRRIQNTLRLQYSQLYKKIRKDKEMKKFIEALKEQTRMAKRAAKIVHEKSALVSMSVNFSGTDLLSALQELHKFQKEL